MTRWTRLLNWTDQPDDWCIRRNGQPVARVYRMRFNGGTGEWCWAVHSGEIAEGHAETFEQALTEVKLRGR